MNDSEKNTIIVGVLSFILISIMLFSNGDFDEYGNFTGTKYGDFRTTQITDNLYVDNINEGPMNFDEAEEYCYHRGMELPTREQAWEMWRASANCKISMVLNNHIIKDKQTFLKSCHNLDQGCLVPANQVNYFCNANKDLLFLDEKVYRYGQYWLKDKFDKNGHYTANFINGMSNAYADNIKLLGVRCVRTIVPSTK